MFLHFLKAFHVNYHCCESNMLDGSEWSKITMLYSINLEKK